MSEREIKSSSRVAQQYELYRRNGLCRHVNTYGLHDEVYFSNIYFSGPGVLLTMGLRCFTNRGAFIFITCKSKETEEDLLRYAMARIAKAPQASERIFPALDIRPAGADFCEVAGWNYL